MAKASLTNVTKKSIYNNDIARLMSQCICADSWDTHISGGIYSSGVKYLTNLINSQWLINEIFVLAKPFLDREAFLTAKISSDEIHITDGNDNILKSKSIKEINFEVDESSLKENGYQNELWFFLVQDRPHRRYVMIWPSEY